MEAGIHACYWVPIISFSWKVGEGKDAIPIRSWRDGGGRRLAPGGGKFWTYSAFALRMSLIFWLVRSVILVCGLFCFAPSCFGLGLFPLA